MTDYAVTGKKRSGKGLFCAGMARDALLAGRPVATNMDLFLEEMLPLNCKSHYFRLPDQPTVADLEAIGLGNQEIDDETNGLIILDECSMIFNARAWGDKERQPILDWLIHSGKLGWDVYYQMQGLEQIDKQVRNTQVEYHIPVKRTDKWPIPFITPLFGLFGLNVRFPKMHVGIIKHGVERDSLVCGRKWFKAKDLYNAYDTRQVFLPRNHPDAVGLHTVLSPWYTKGRYLTKIPPKWLRFIYGMIGYDWQARAEQETKLNNIRNRPKHPLVAKLRHLPPEEAMRHWRRLNELGYFDRKTPTPSATVIQLDSRRRHPESSNAPIKTPALKAS